ncbi:MAG: hypothetical protein BJ554DRAFT_5691, partial [Olpidium bornovanus]
LPVLAVAGAPFAARARNRSGGGGFPAGGGEYLSPQDEGETQVQLGLCVWPPPGFLRTSKPPAGQPPAVITLKTWQSIGPHDVWASARERSTAAKQRTVA